MEKNSRILILKPAPDYALIDSGDGEKLERFGTITLSRPDPQALWTKRLSAAEWKKADAHFTREESGGKWAFKEHVPAKWSISFGGLTCWIKPTAFKHTGLFPEQAVNWEWMADRIAEGKGDTKSTVGDIEVLNLFGYTGGASLACAKAGAKVVHIDGSKAAVTWARENAEASGLAGAPIRWIIEDARIFVEREIKRGRKYHGIVMDPPAFGHGPDNELWKIEEHFLPLVEACKKLLADKPLFFLINGYSAGYSALAYENVLRPLREAYGGSIETGELAIEEEVKKEEGKGKNGPRLLPAGIFARWSAK